MLDNNSLNSKIAQLRALEAQMSALSKEAELIKSELKSELDTCKVDSIDTGIHKIFYTVYQKVSVDTTKLKEAGLYETYSKPSLITQFKITDNKCTA